PRCPVPHSGRGRSLAARPRCCPPADSGVVCNATARIHRLQLFPRTQSSAGFPGHWPGTAAKEVPGRGTGLVEAGVWAWSVSCRIGKVREAAVLLRGSNANGSKVRYLRQNRCKHRATTAKPVTFSSYWRDEERF